MPVLNSGAPTFSDLRAAGDDDADDVEDGDVKFEYEEQTEVAPPACASALQAIAGSVIISDPGCAIMMMLILLLLLLLLSCLVRIFFCLSLPTAVEIKDV